MNNEQRIQNIENRVQKIERMLKKSLIVNGIERPDLITISDFCKLKNCAYHTVYNQIQRNEIPHEKYGCHHYIKIGEVE